jgi:excisionase family DNA binding protein
MTELASRYMGVSACAIYLGRSEKSVRRLVEKRQIPVSRIGRRLTFDRDRIDAWVGRHAQRGAMV